MEMYVRVGIHKILSQSHGYWRTACELCSYPVLILVVVDVSSDDSMDMAGYWKQQVINTLTKHTDMSTVDALRLPILLIGNKYDLVSAIV